MSRPTASINTIKVRVQTKASRNQVDRFAGDTLRIRVTAPPEDGKANQVVIDLLANGLNVAKSSIRIVRGHSSRDKLVSVDALGLEDIRRRLEYLGK